MLGSWEPQPQARNGEDSRPWSGLVLTPRTVGTDWAEPWCPVFSIATAEEGADCKRRGWAELHVTCRIWLGPTLSPASLYQHRLTVLGPGHSLTPTAPAAPHGPHPAACGSLAS